MANRERDDVASGLNDLLGNVIQSDRRRSGRGHESPQEPEPTPLPDRFQPYDIMTENSVINEEDKQTLQQTPPNEPTDRPPSPKVPPTRRTSRLETAAPTTSLAARREQASALAETPTMTVTLRIPQAFNEWLDEYVHRSWPTRIRKQELVTEALQLLYARRGRAGNEILETELLTEKDT